MCIFFEFKLHVARLFDLTCLSLSALFHVQVGKQCKLNTSCNRTFLSNSDSSGSDLKSYGVNTWNISTGKTKNCTW